jgi:orotidine-5'-phosphate decarboxylase
VRGAEFLMAVFADRAIEKLRARGNPLCVGLDPYPELIPAFFGDAREGVGAIENFFREILPIAAKHAVAVKPQMGFFEPYGEAGYGLARALSAEAQTLGLIAILDAKRGDIGTTAEGYARAAFGAAPGFDADMLTVNAYLGRDSLEPFLQAAQKRERALAVLVRTSNPGARDLQDLPVNGAPLWERVAEMLAPESSRLKGESGWSGMGVVCGATYPAEAKRLRALLPEALFLVPGFGAQGAGARDAVAGFVPGPNGLEGGFVSSSRAALYPQAAAEAKTIAAWRQAIDNAMAEAASTLRTAIGG